VSLVLAGAESRNDEAGGFCDVLSGFGFGGIAISIDDDLQQLFVLMPNVSGFFIHHQYFTHDTLRVSPVGVHGRRNQQVVRQTIHKMVKRHVGADQLSD